MYVIHFRLDFFCTCHVELDLCKWASLFPIQASVPGGIPDPFLLFLVFINNLGLFFFVDKNVVFVFCFFFCLVKDLKIKIQSKFTVGIVRIGIRSYYHSFILILFPYTLNTIRCLLAGSGDNEHQCTLLLANSKP